MTLLNSFGSKTVSKMKSLVLVSLIVLVNIVNVIGTSVRVDPLVLIDQGLVRGQKATDGDYSSFLGIPYAEVDLDNPFGPAQPHPGFTDIFNAFDASIKCPQNSDSGIETLDCLRLNIYVPNQASSRNPLPVLVFIHGGGFGMRSGGEFNPSYLVKQGILVVTINYRLGPYGFMCLDDPAVPGNEGIKDQYKALQWVRNNIAAFGGNPYEVTLAGESAGAASVLYHLYSSQTKLYNKVIVQSDTPQGEGMFIKKDLDAARKLAAHLGFETDDNSQALAFLSKSSPSLVVAATRELNLQLKPCKENILEGVDNIITSDPMSLSNIRKLRSTPILIGHTTKEHKGALLDIYGENYLNTDPFYEKLKAHFKLDEDELVNLANIVRHFYVGDEAVSVDLIPLLEDFDSDFVFNHPVQRTIANLLQEEATVYEYLFSYSSSSSDDGVSHAAENDYLFESPNSQLTDNDQLIVDRITTLWTNFVKNGNPTPSTSNLLPVIWTPVTSDRRPYLVIDTDIRIENRVFNERMAFWDLFYSIYGQYDSFIDE